MNLLKRKHFPNSDLVFECNLFLAFFSHVSFPQKLKAKRAVDCLLGSGLKLLHLAKLAEFVPANRVE